MKTEKGYGDRVLETMMGDLFDDQTVETGKEAIATLVRVLSQQAKALESESHKPEKMKSGELAKSVNHVGKTLSEVTRLLSFVLGGPDSRVGGNEEAALEALFEKLDDEQIRLVSGWLKQAQAGRGPEPTKH